MRLLRRESNGIFTLHSFAETEIPAYAILSHRWGPNDEEVILQDLSDQQHATKPGWGKLKFCADRVDRDGLMYFWIDTCCIDKTNLVELSESIISMFEWYRRASRCYVYLSDVSKSSQDGHEHLPDASWKSAFRRSQWFTRGWTLQELLAPLKVQFFSKEGNYLGDKESLDQSIHEITGIAFEALRGRSLLSFSVEDRMSWIESRSTTRGEDLAYCLLGIFDISMPVLYGEGKEKALARLRLEIDRFHRRPLNNIESVPQITDTKAKLDLIRQNLRFDEIDDRYRNITPHHADTCQWFLGTAEYRSWLQQAQLPSHHGILWIKGKPGSGKSTIIKFLFEKHRKKATKILLLSFFFSARGAALEKSAVGLYRSLLHQLLTKPPTCEWLSTAEWSDCHTRSWTVRRLQDLLETIILEFGKRPLMIFIDALDECPEAEVRDLIAFFERLCKQTQHARVNLRVCFSSRHYPHISVRRSEEIVLETQRFQSDDIRRYVQDCLDMNSEEGAVQIHEEICRRASGVFMWVVLVVRILKEEYDHGCMPALRQKLKAIPDDLHALFSDILLRDDKHISQVSCCLKWIFHSLRPLTPEELYQAIAIDTQDEMLNGPSLQEGARQLPGFIERYIISRSKGLAEITRTDHPKVQFIHESVRDFLCKAGNLINLLPWLAYSLGSINKSMKESCIRYLEAAQLQAQNSTNYVEDYGLLTTEYFVLLDYTVNHLFLHAEIAEKNGISPNNLIAGTDLEFWVRAYTVCVRKVARNFSRTTASLLYILCLFGCTRLADIELRKPSSANEYRDDSGFYRYPFFAALYEKHRDTLATFFRLEEVLHEHTVQRECQRCALDRDLDQLVAENSQRSSYKASITPFYHLLNCKSSLAVRYLSTQRVRTLDASTWQRVMAMIAAQEPETSMEALWRIRIHLHSAKLDETTKLEISIKVIDDLPHPYRRRAAKFVFGRTKGVSLNRSSARVIARQIAFLFEWTESCELLNEVGLESPDEWGLQVLHVFLEEGYPRLAEFMLEKIIAPSANDQLASSALIYAVKQDYYTLMNLLVSKGANLNAGDLNGQTALHEAVRLDRMETVNLLLSRGANIQVRDQRARTILHVVATTGNVSMAKLFLSRGIDIKAVDETGKSALCVAVGSIRSAMVEFLLYKGADIDVEEGTKERLLMIGLCTRRIEIVALLVYLSVDITQMDLDGWISAYVAVITGIVDYGKIIPSSSCRDRTCFPPGNANLCIAFRSGNTEMLHLVQSTDASINTSTRLCLALLISAAESNLLDTIEILLTRSVNDDTSNHWRSMGSGAAASARHATMIDKLLRSHSGMNRSETLAKDYETALEYLVSYTGPTRMVNPDWT